MRGAGRSRWGVDRQNVVHAARVAALAAGLIAALYVVVVGVFDLIAFQTLESQLNGRVESQLDAAVARASVNGAPGTALTGPPDIDRDIDAAPVFLWQTDRTGHTVAASTGAPELEPGPWSEQPGLSTMTLGSSPFRLDSTRHGGGWLVAGESLADLRHVERLLLGAEVLAAPLLLLAVFLGSTVIGLRALAPVEQSRRRQLEFTADASHELRTPLSVIEAEVGLARGARRDPADYASTLERIGDESRRLRTIVEDLLWLARFDAEPPPPGDEPVDLAAAAEGCVDRFVNLAAARRIALRVEAAADDPVWIDAPPEWIDRLIGVLVDNACRHAGEGGTARVTVSAGAGRGLLVVEDSGPGIPPAERPRLFDRFHRASDGQGGHGLGLAIGDSVVRSTGGRWSIGDSDLGGARFEVSWPATVPDPGHLHAVFRSEGASSSPGPPR